MAAAGVAITSYKTLLLAFESSRNAVCERLSSKGV
jgi:hypothetical protein